MALTLRGHMAADWHTCEEQRASQRGQVGQKGHSEAGRRNGACAAPRETWIGKTTTTLLRFLRTPAPTRDYRRRTTVPVRRRASTWADRSTRSTRLRPWELWTRPTFQISSRLTLYPCGRTRARLSFIILWVCSPSSSRRSPRLLATLTRGSRADIPYLSPGWKPPNPTHTPGKDSGQVIIPKPRNLHKPKYLVLLISNKSWHLTALDYLNII